METEVIACMFVFLSKTLKPTSELFYERSFIWTVEKQMKTWLIFAVLHSTKAVVKLELEKNSGLKGIYNPDLSDTGALNS